MNKTTIVLLACAVIVWVCVFMATIGFGFQEDAVKICSFLNECVIIDQDDFLNKKQMDKLENLFEQIRKQGYYWKTSVGIRVNESTCLTQFDSSQRMYSSNNNTCYILREQREIK